VLVNNQGCDGYDTSFCGGLNMELFWNIFFWLIPLWVFVLIPFSTFYYEADDGMLMAGTSVAPNPVRKSKLYQALCWQMVVFVFVFILFLVTYLLWSETEIPVQEYTGVDLATAATLGSEFRGTFHQNEPRENVTDGTLLPFSTSQLLGMDANDALYVSETVDNGEQVITLQVSVSTFYGGLMAWIGWFFFALFGGIGMAALPLDLYLTYKNRPRHMDAAEFAEAQLSLRERVNELVDIGEIIKVEKDANPMAVGFRSVFDSEARKDRGALLEFKAAVFLLEKDVEDFQACTSQYDKYNPLTPYVAILLSFCSGIISFFWVIHIIVYVLPNQPLAPFLNNYFEWFDNWFPLFGVLSVALFTMYLLFCAVKGCFKFGLRVMCITLHPMKVGKTYMSSFMFNIGLILLCALPVVQFASTAFADYARFSTIRQIFGVQIENLKFFGWWWTNNVFVYVFLALVCMSTVYLLCKPKDTASSAVDLRDRLRSRRS
jgi:LMBR1 domain-containing protein 1